MIASWEGCFVWTSSFYFRKDVWGAVTRWRFASIHYSCPFLAVTDDPVTYSHFLCEPYMTSYRSSPLIWWPGKSHKGSPILTQKSKMTLDCQPPISSPWVPCAVCLLFKQYAIWLLLSWFVNDPPRTRIPCDGQGIPRWCQMLAYRPLLAVSCSE